MSSQSSTSVISRSAIERWVQQDDPARDAPAGELSEKDVDVVREIGIAIAKQLYVPTKSEETLKEELIDALQVVFQHVVKDWGEEGIDPPGLPDDTSRHVDKVGVNNISRHDTILDFGGEPADRLRTVFKQIAHFAVIELEGQIDEATGNKAAQEQLRDLAQFLQDEFNMSDRVIDDPVGEAKLLLKKARNKKEEDK